MQLSATIRGTTYAFRSVKEVLARANPPKSGDDLAGVSARDPVERANLPPHQIVHHRPVQKLEPARAGRFPDDDVRDVVATRVAEHVVGAVGQR